MNNNQEYILCAAVWFDNSRYYEHQPKNIARGMVFCGRRHHNCFPLLAQAFPRRNFEGITTQGFLTSTDKFVDRVQAAEIALHAEQITALSYSETELFSEDLY